MENREIPAGYVRCPHPIHPAIVPATTCSLRCRHAAKCDAAKKGAWKIKRSSKVPYDANCSKCPIGLALIGRKPKKLNTETEKTKGQTQMKTKTPLTEALETPVASETPVAPEVPVKKCTRCGKEYPMTATYFHKNPAYGCGFNGFCRACKNARQRADYEKNKAAKHAVPAEAAEKEIFPETKRAIDSFEVRRKLDSLKVYGDIEHASPEADVEDYDMMAESFGRANTTLVLDFSGHEDLLSAICAEAKKDLRLPSMQALWHLTRIPTLSTGKEA